MLCDFLDEEKMLLNGSTIVMGKAESRLVFRTVHLWDVQSGVQSG